MTRTNIYHALGLHMHQPPGNLDLLIEANPWEAGQILHCYERPALYALRYRDVARFHVGFSGILLEQLTDPRIVDRFRQIADIPEILSRYREADNIELIGMGYYHPIFPLIPMADWAEQLQRGREVMEQAFGRAPKGFWPPEMAFCMEMIPALVESGYDYVVVDGVHVRPEDGISDVFRPYVACHDGVCITVVPRDREISNAQETGLDPGWFHGEVRARVDDSPRPRDSRLVTTWSDGENGGWFRQSDEAAGFFGRYFKPYMEHVRSGDYPITPVALSEYLRRAPAAAQAQVQTGAWNVAGSSGLDLKQWAGSDAQRAAVDEVGRLSGRYWAIRDRLRAGESQPEALVRARRLILEAETSCFLFWGDSWIPFLYERTGPGDAELDAAESELNARAFDEPSPAETAPVATASAAAAGAGRVRSKRPVGRKPGARNRSRPGRGAGSRPGKTAAGARRKSKPPAARSASRRGSPTRGTSLGGARPARGGNDRSRRGARRRSRR